MSASAPSSIDAPGRARCASAEVASISPLALPLWRGRCAGLHGPAEVSGEERSREVNEGVRAVRNEGASRKKG